MRDDVVPEERERPLLTLRVSRDGGKTWGKRVEITSTAPVSEMWVHTWPPCACPRCASQKKGRQ
jgi:hypothetical protein